MSIPNRGGWATGLVWALPPVAVVAVLAGGAAGLPSGESYDARPDFRVASKVTGIKLTSKTQAHAPDVQANPDTRTTVAVGEKVDVKVSIDPNPYHLNELQIDWGVSGNGGVFDEDHDLYSASNQAGTLTLSASITPPGANQPVTQTITFTVVEPALQKFVSAKQGRRFPVGKSGVQAFMTFEITPTSVPFKHLAFMEGLAPGVAGAGDVYFTRAYNGQLPAHDRAAGAFSVYRVDAQNRNVDKVGGGPFPRPWAAGSFSWDIPQTWELPQTAGKGSMVKQLQTFGINAAGTASITKFGHTSTRTAQDVFTP